MKQTVEVDLSLLTLQLDKEFVGHKSEVSLMLSFGGHLISVDVDGFMIVWETKSQSEWKYSKQHTVKPLFFVRIYFHGQQPYFSTILILFGNFLRF